MWRELVYSRTVGLGLAFLIASLVISPLDGLARQAASGEGEVRLVHWPDVVYETQGAMDIPSMRAADQYGELAVLPRVDTLALRYAWSVVDGLPRIDFELRWVRGSGGIVDGRLVADAEMPEGIVLDLADLHADVVVGGERAGDLVLSLDSLYLPPDPDAYLFGTRDVTWSDIFASMDSTAARRAFTAGFSLERLDILRVGFEEVSEADERYVPVVVRRRPVRRTVIVPDFDVWIGWDLWPDAYRPPPRGVPRRREPRGDRTGRTATEGQGAPGGTTRGGTRTRDEGDSGGGSVWIPGAGKSDDDEDDDDDSELLGPALVGVAAVGVLLAAGGTIGIQGSGDTPIGLFSGAVTPRWAFFVHVAVNPEVAKRDDGEKLRAGMLWALRPFAGSLRPAFGAGVLATELGDDVEVDPTVDLGLVYARGQVVVLVTVDALSGQPRIGLGVNLKGGR
jgi:hypothetical protein